MAANRTCLALIVLATLAAACSSGGDDAAVPSAPLDSAGIPATPVPANEPDVRGDEDESDWEEFAVAPLAVPAAVDLPGPTTRVECPEATVTVSDAAGLEDALTAAGPGDVVAVEPGRYDGNFVATAVATGDEPVFLCGPADAVLAGEGPGESGYVLHLDGAQHWRVVGLTVRDGRKGVIVDGGVGNVLQALTVTSIGDEAIHLRADSTDNAVLDNAISDTGIRREKFGEGVYVGSAQSNWCTISDCRPDRSDRNVIEGNTISGTTSEAIDIKEGTADGVVLDNSFDGAAMTESDSWVDVKGNGWVLAGNRGTNAPEHGIQTHEIIAGWGSGNAFVGNVLAVDAAGYGFDMHGPDDSNLLACDNEVEGAGEGFANEDCR